MATAAASSRAQYQTDLLASWPAWLLYPSSKIERRFASFHALNPHVYLQFEARASEAHRAGAARIGMKAIAERIRWDVHTRTLGEEFKLNNTFVALYARLLIWRRPELAALIELRRRKNGAENGSDGDEHSSSPFQRAAAASRSHGINP